MMNQETFNAYYLQWQRYELYENIMMFVLILCLVLSAVIIFNIIVGINNYRGKWMSDVDKMMILIESFGISIALIATVFVIFCITKFVSYWNSTNHHVN